MFSIETAWRQMVFGLRGGNRLSGCEDEFSLRTFHLALTTFLMWDAVMSFAVVPLFAVQKVLGACILLSVGVAAAVSVLLLRRFHRRTAASLFLGILWCCLEVYSTFSGGIRGGGGYFSVVIVIAAAWLIGVGPAVGLVCATLAVSFTEAALEATGHNLPVYFHGPPFALWAGQCGLIALTIGPILAFPKALRTQIAALRDSEERFRSLSDASVEGIMIHDGTIILNCNLTFARMFGYDEPQELIGRHAVETLVSTRSLPRIRERMVRTELTSIEVTCLRKDGSEFPVETGVRLIKYQGRDARLVSCKDLSDRNRALEAMRESEERYRALFDRSLDCVVLADFEGHVLDANQAWMDLFGYGREDFKNLTMQSLLSAEQLPVVQERVGRMLGPVVQKQPQEYQMRRRDGSAVFVEVQSSLLYRNGEPAAILAIGRDVTERKRAEAEKTRLEKQLFEAQKMESIGRLAGGVAHDFNNLLTVINGYSKMLVNHQAGSAQRRYAEQIHKAGESAASLTRQLLAFSRREVSHPQVVLLNGIVAESREMLGRMAGEDIEMKTVLNASPDRVLADPNQIHQCLMNLVVNGRDAMPAGGRLTIETGNLLIGPQDLPVGSDAEPGHYVFLRVRDTGIGMNEETSRHIFEPFFTTKEKGRGTGLGLSTVYGIVNQWRGFIRFASEPDQGTEFSIFLPLCAMTKPECGEPAEEEAASAPASETLLVVEDQDIVREFVVESLRANGYAVLEACNGRDALRILEDHSAIQLLMTDVLMPGMGGRALAAQARALYPSLKVLFMTGYADGATDDIAGQDGREEVIMKPFSPEVLEARVRGLLHPAKGKGAGKSPS